MEITHTIIAVSVMWLVDTISVMRIIVGPGSVTTAVTSACAAQTVDVAGVL
jgi:hypothetical protein